MKMENAQNAEKALGDYEDNLQQTKDRLASVEEIFKKNKDVYQTLQSDGGNTVFDHISIFETKVAEWEQTVNEILSEIGRTQPAQLSDTYESEAQPLFDVARNSLDMIGVILEQNAENQMNQITDNKNTVMIQTIVLIAITVVIALIFGGIIVRNITKPIQNITRVLKKITDGDLRNSHMEINSKDELGMLSAYFNDMTKTLKNLITSVQESSEHVASASEELSATTNENSRATEQISSSIQQVAAGSEMQVKNIEKALKLASEGARGMQEVSASMNSTLQTAEETNRKAVEGSAMVNHTINHMNQVQNQVQESSRVVHALGNKIKQIEKILQLISDIAEQTNLLALNAAIEAARAGEHGQGFAVVADEVRKLAEESTKATEDISSIIREILAESDNAVQAMGTGTESLSEGIIQVEQTGKSFKEITDKIKTVLEQAQSVANIARDVSGNTQQMETMMQEIKTASEEASESAQNVAASTEEQLASIEEISSTSESLSQMAEEVKESISRFKI